MRPDHEGRVAHARRLELSRRRVLQGILATSGALAAGGGLVACAPGGSTAQPGTTAPPTGWQTQGTARAEGIILPPGTRPNPDLPEGEDTIPQVEHVVIYMQENHSFDQYFGMLGRGDGFTLDAAGVPTNANPDKDNQPFKVFKAGATCETNIGGDHSWNAEHLAVNGGKMDGFIRGNGGNPNVMGYYDESDLPFYWGLAKTFPLCDRWFCSVRGPTHPNRRFLQAATSVGIVQTSVPEVIATPTAPNGTIWHRLDAHGITWKDYMFDLGDIYLFPTPDLNGFSDATAANRRSFSDFLRDCERGTLPNVSILAPALNGHYDEGARDVQNGESYSAVIINALMSSPAWSKTVCFFTYDENGGGYDHVPPPTAVAPDDIAPRIDAHDQPGDFTQLGPRVPGFVISPFAKRDYVSSVVHDHTSILKFIETKWNLGAMTYRDANADDLLDTLDFDDPGFREPPTLPSSALTPDLKSICEPQPYPAFDPGAVTPDGPPSRGGTTLDSSLNALAPHLVPGPIIG